MSPGFSVLQASAVLWLTVLVPRASLARLPRERFSVERCANNVARAIVFSAFGISGATTYYRLRWSLHCTD